MRKRWAVVTRNNNDIEIQRQEFVTRKGADRECKRVNEMAINSDLAHVARQYVDHPMPPPWYAGVEAIR